MLFSLCHCNAISDPGSNRFDIEVHGVAVSLFVVHKNGEFHAYINSCPHTGVNLEWNDDQFLDLEMAYIQCATHDALFEITTGNCISGPCVGDRLQPVILKINDSTLYADISKLTIASILTTR